MLKIIRGYETLFLINYKRHPSIFKPGWKSPIQRTNHHHQDQEIQVLNKHFYPYTELLVSFPIIQAVSQDSSYTMLA